MRILRTKDYHSTEQHMVKATNDTPDTNKNSFRLIYDDEEQEIERDRKNQKSMEMKKTLYEIGMQPNGSIIKKLIFAQRIEIDLCVIVI